MINSTRFILGGVVFSTVFLFSCFMSGFYIYGDQAIYTSVYDRLSGLNITDAYSFYHRKIDTVDNFHFLISYLFSHLGFSKIIVMSMFNGILACLIFMNMERMQINRWLTFTLIFSFYAFVLYFSAERLKFGFIFFLASTLALPKKNSAILFFLFAIMSHLQIAITYTSLFFSKLKKYTLTRFSKNNLYMVMVVIFYFLINYQHVVKRVGDNLTHLFWMDFAKFLTFYVISLRYAKDKFSCSLAFAPVFLALSLFGSNRVVMIAYVTSLFFLLRVNRGVNYPIVVFSVYYALKGAMFLTYIVIHGNGFYQPNV